jgi:hydroxyethylthiazole kinase-like uncharacterized protein yjeF
MQRAGAAAAAEIARRMPHLLSDGAIVVAGSGNNGGDGWIVAAALHAVGIGACVVEVAPARTVDARAERDAAIAAGVAHTDDVDVLARAPQRLAVDAILGTGLRADAPLEGPVARGVAALHEFERRGGTIVALDVPSGVDASSGLHIGAPRCALTLVFGTMKRGLLVARDRCGEIVLLDIGLGAHAHAAGDARLATASWFRTRLPRIPADAHKGTRGKLAVVGGATGMAGAAVLAARAALRSGIGLVRCVVAPESIGAVQEGEPAALAAAWPSTDDQLDALARWADVLLIGPGLGRDGTRARVERLLGAFRGPVVLDADALNAFAGDAGALAPLLAGREALLTPHPAELARLVGTGVDAVLEGRFTLPLDVARQTGASVLLKGVPTVVASRDGAAIVVAEGTPILATGGAGDLLGGIAATLLGQGCDALAAGALAAFAHGRAASLVSQRAVRGYTLDDVLRALPDVWSLDPPPPRPPVLVELPMVGESE